jgi:hypothetical protein
LKKRRDKLRNLRELFKRCRDSRNTVAHLLHRARTSVMILALEIMGQIHSSIKVSTEGSSPLLEFRVMI